jgi:hypothetical protein
MPEAPRLDWNRVRHFPAHPFGRISRLGADIIKPCGFRLWPDTTYDVDGRNYTLDAVTDTTQIAPSFRLAANEMVLRRVQLEVSDLRLSIVVKDHLNKSYIFDRQFLLSDCPTEINVTAHTLAQVAIYGNIEFCLVLSLNRPLDRLHGRPWLVGHILAEKTFSVRRPPPAPSFPIRFVPAAEFLERGLPESTVWFTHYLDDLDFDKPPEEVFQVWINDKFEDDLRRLDQVPNGNLLWGAIEADVLSDLVLHFINSDDPETPPTDNRGLKGALSNLIVRRLGIAVPEVKALVENDPNRLRAQIYALMDFGQRIRSAAASRNG